MRGRKIVPRPYFVDTLTDKLAVLRGRLLGQNQEPCSADASRLTGDARELSKTVHRGHRARTKRRTSWTPFWTNSACVSDGRPAPGIVQEPYFVDAPAGQKSSRRSYPQPLPWVLSRPYFVDASPYIIPSKPYIVLSGPYIVAKTMRQAAESIAICAPKTSTKT